MGSSIGGCSLIVGSLSKDGADEVDAGFTVPDAAGPSQPSWIHARSIGAPGTLAADGTLSGAANSVALSGAILPSTVGRGDRLLLWPDTGDQQELFIDSLLNPTQLVTQTPLQGPIVQAPYRIERAHSSVASWSTESWGDLIADKRREVGLLYDDGVIEENIVIAGAQANETYYRVLSVAKKSRHRGVAGTGVVISPTTAGHGITVAENFAIIEWVEVTDWSTNVGGSYDGIHIAAGGVLIQNVLVHDDGHGSIENSDAGGIQLETDYGSASVRNSIVYGTARNGIAIHDVDFAFLRIENTTIYRCVEEDNSASEYGCVGLTGDFNQITATNVIAMDSGGSDFKVGFSSKSEFYDCNNNLSSDSTAPGATSIHGETASSIFVSTTLGLEDLHVNPGTAAVDNAWNLSEWFADDIDGEPRGSTWDIGADER